MIYLSSTDKAIRAHEDKDQIVVKFFSEKLVFKPGVVKDQQILQIARRCENMHIICHSAFSIFVSNKIF